MIRPARHTPPSHRFTTVSDDQRATPIESLFRAVIDQAFRDAVTLPKIWYSPTTPGHLATTRQRLQDEARRWLLSPGRDFRLICDLAGRDPAEVHEQARRLLGDPELAAAYAASPRSSGRHHRGPKGQPA